MSTHQNVNVKNMTTKITISIISVVLLGVGIVYWTMSDQNNYISDHCPGYEAIPAGFTDSANFIDCSNIIAIEQWAGEDHYVVLNFSIDSEYYHDQLIANIPRYLLIDSQLYFVEEPSINRFSYGSRCDDEECSSETKYMTTYSGGEKQTMEYSTVEDIPLYRKIDTKTGDFTLYESIESAPENERSIFEELTI